MKHILLLISAFLLSSTIYGQADWHAVESGTSSTLHCIDFPNEQNGFIGGEGTLLRSTDGGMNWTALDISTADFLAIPNWTIFDIQFLDDNLGYVVVTAPDNPFTGGVYRTMDGGLTWTAAMLTSSGFCQFGSIYFLDEDLGFAGGAGCFQNAIVDRFEAGSWSSTTSPLSGWTEDRVLNFDFVDDDNGIAVTEGAHIMRTIDGGLNWDTIPQSVTQGALTDVAYLGSDLIFISHELEAGGFGVLVSEDGGLTWDVHMETATFFYPDMNAVHITNGGLVYFGGYSETASQGILFDHESGTNWNYQEVNEAVHDLDSYSDTVVFAVGTNGSIYVNHPPSTLSVDENSLEISLSIFPNPAVDQLNIDLSEDWRRAERLRVYDSAGSLILERPINSQMVRMATSDLAGGSYSIEVLANGNSSTRRFVKK